MRPVDIARQLHISTTTLRSYEADGLIPPVGRSAAGYRLYTDEHVAYFIAIREMMTGFGLTVIAKMMQELISKRTTAALWLATQAQAELQQEKTISGRVAQRLLRQHHKPLDPKQLFSIHDVSRETGIPATTIRYWDRVGLVSAERLENNYRMFTAEQVQRILAIYALKLSAYAAHQKHFIDRVRADLQGFDYGDKGRISAMTKSIERYLDQVNRDQIKGIAALHRLCEQVEANSYQ